MKRMETQELLKPRYKVIADYPQNNFPVGYIFPAYEVEVDKVGQQFIDIELKVMAKYPHLFRPLQWWEERKPEEMPDWLKDAHGEVWRVREYTKSNVVYLLKNFKDNDSPYGDHDLYGLSPASKEEYDNQKTPTP